MGHKPSGDRRHTPAKLWSGVAAALVVAALAGVVPVGSGLFAGAHDRAAARGHAPRLHPALREDSAQLVALERAAVAWRRWRAGPAAARQRLQSRVAYRNLSPRAAGALLERDFGRSVVGGADTPAANPAIAGHVVRYLNAREAVVMSSTGVHKLAISSVPLLTRANGRPARPVDLRLSRTTVGFEPANPLVPVLIGQRLGDGVAVGSDGLRLTLRGANVPVRLIQGSTGSTPFFADVATDTDAVEAPTSAGAELYAVLRSPLSPETLDYAVTLPPGASLSPLPGNAIGVFRGKKLLAEVVAPVAVDAQRASVPVTMRAVGSTLVLTVAHRSASFAYPILVDPAVIMSPDEGAWGETEPPSAQVAALISGGPYGIAAAAGCYEGNDEGGGCSGLDESNWLALTWTWGTNDTVDPSLVQNPSNWTIYDLWSGTNDSSNSVLAARMYAGSCPSDPGVGVFGTAGPVTAYGEYSFNMYTDGCSMLQPWFETQLGATTTGYSNGAISSFGTFLITYTCDGDCFGGPTGWGEGDPVQPDTPRPECGLPVNCQNGNQYEVQTDLSIPGRGLGLSLVRTYNSQAGADGLSGPFGAGWSSSFSDHLTVGQASGLNFATVTEADGNRVTFWDYDGTYEAPTWAHAALVQNGDGTYTLTLTNQESFHFDSSGQLISEADRNGETDTVGYDSQGRLSTITDPEGRTITLSYNPSGLVASATDSAGRTVSYSYSGENLVGVTAADGGVWSFGYDASHQMTSMTDPRGGTVTTTYNSSNQVATQTDPAGRKRTWTYSPGETLIQNPDGTETDEHFNSNNLLSSITYGYGTSAAATTSFAYDAYQDLAAVTDPNGNVSSYLYDRDGNLIQATDPLNRVTHWTYDDLNDVTSMTDPLGNTTTYTYDSNGNLLSVSAPLAGSGQTQTTTYTRGDASHPGDVTAITDPNGNTTSYTYDSYGDVTSVTDPLGNVTTYTYDTLGRRTSMVSPRGNVPGANPAAFTTTYTYDPLSRLTSETDPLGHTQRWSYDGDGNLVSYTDAEGHATSYSYDPDNELTAVTRPDGTTLRSSYDAAGNLTSQADGAGRTTSYGYNPLEQLTSATDPLSRETTYAYDADGNVTGVTDAAGRTTSYDYDADNELTSISYSDGTTPDVSYSYDADGQRTTMSDGTGSTSYNYDPLGRLTATTDGAGNTISYAYDLANNPTSITYPSGKTITRTYDADERLASITDWLGNTTSFGYGPDSNLKTITFPSATGNVDTYTYNDADQVNGVQMTQGATTLASLAYTREPDGTLASDDETGLPEPPLSGTRAYGYDNADNITENESSSGYTYDQADELTASPGHTYSYDQLGERTNANSTSGPSITYAYDQAGRLTSATPSGGTSTTLAYNGDGLRTSETTGSDTSQFTWDQIGDLPLVLTDGTNSYIYGPDDVPIEQISQSGTPTYLHHDQVGSIRLITNQDGNSVGSFTYTPYGSLAASTGTATSPFGYAGQYTDPETGLQYDQARYYDPQTGQFLTRDPLEALTGEPYSYAADSPLNAADPSGLDTVPSGGGLDAWGELALPAGADEGETEPSNENDETSRSGTDPIETTTDPLTKQEEEEILCDPLSGPAETLAAAEDEGSALLHYTTADRAEQILDDGQINPSADGKTYLTPDRYTEGSTAQSRLSMGTKPEGYIEVPRPTGAPEPTVVDPFNGQPGGGLEVPIVGPVAVPPGSLFTPF